MSAFRSAFERLFKRAPLAPSAPRSRWLVALGVLLIALAGLEFVYLVAANLFLNLNGLALAFASTNQVNATIRAGWTVIPGRVHVRNARVTFQDHNVQFSIDMQRGFLVLQLRELLQRSFHVLQLRGEGVAFRMRNRIDPWDKNEAWVGALAPIPEFASPAVVEAYVPEPPIPDAQYNLWKVHFDDVDVGVSEAWAQQFRYTGSGRARGKFQLKPGRELWVGPATLALAPGLLSAGTYRIAPGIHGHIDCTVHPFDVRPVHGVEPLRYVSAHIRLDSSTLDPQVYALFGNDPQTQVSSASGSLHLDAEIQRGVLTPQSVLDIMQHGLQLRTEHGDLDSESIELHASSPHEGSQATLIIEHGTVKDPIALGYPPRVETARVTVSSDNRDTSKDFHLKEATLNEARLHLRDARWLNRWLQTKDFAISGGGAAVLARGHYAAGELNGEALVETNGIEARLSESHLRYAGAVALHLMQVDPEKGTGTAVADVTGRSLRAELGKGEFNLAGLQVKVLARRDAAGNKLHGEAHLSSLSSTGTGVDVQAPELTLQADSEQTADGTQLTHFIAQIPALRAEGRGARLTSSATARGTFAQPKNKSEQRLEVKATLLHPVATLSGSLARKAVAPRVDVKAKLSQDAGGALSGTLALLPAVWHVDSGNMRFSGQSALAMELARLDLGRHTGTVAARLTSTGVTVGDTKQNAACPWSRVQAVQVDAQAHLLADKDTAISVNGEFGQTEMSWGDFTTRADIGVNGNFDLGLLDRDGGGKVNLSFRHASLQSGGAEAQGWAAQMPKLDIEAQLAQRSGKLSGTAKVNIEGARGRIGETKVNTDMNAQFVVDDLDLTARTAHASGVVHVRNAALPKVADPVSNWWADVNLDSVYGHAGENLELGGTFRANLRDATPGLAVLSEQGSLPKWVASAFPLRDLSVTGSLARRCRLTDIHLVNLSGGPAVARGRLQSVPNGFQGALLMRVAGFGAVSAGLDFDANHTHFGMFDGDAWLERWSQSFDRQSDQAAKLVCPPVQNQCTEQPAGQTSSAGE
ncbi:MAG: hypothetical protein ABI488_07790 [Polyangiaceae bacterium]